MIKLVLLPTHYDLAQCILLLMVTEKYGIYHVSNEGSCSWYEFAKAIFEEADIDMNVTPCETTEFPRKAPRPKYSVLMETALSANGFPKMRNWKEALTHFFEKFAQHSSDKNLMIRGWLKRIKLRVDESYESKK